MDLDAIVVYLRSIADREVRRLPWSSEQEREATMALGVAGCVVVDDGMVMYATRSVTDIRRATYRFVAVIDNVACMPTMGLLAHELLDLLIDVVEQGSPIRLIEYAFLVSPPVFCVDIESGVAKSIYLSGNFVRYSHPSMWRGILEDMIYVLTMTMLMNEYVPLKLVEFARRMLNEIARFDLGNK